MGRNAKHTGGKGHRPHVALRVAPTPAKAGAASAGCGRGDLPAQSGMVPAGDAACRDLAAALHESEARYRDLFEHAGDLVQIATPGGQLREANPAWCTLLGYQPEEIQGLSVFDILHPDYRARYRQQLLYLLLDEPVANDELVFLARDGRKIVVEGAIKLTFVDGAPVSSRGIFHDITAHRQAEEALRELASRDGLTGLYNRRELNRQLDEEVLRSARYGRAVTLLMLDIDHFQQINDTHGHQVGDDVLRWVARLAMDNVRAADRVARYGGEELAVIMPETTERDAFEVAERIRQAVAAQPFTPGEEHPPALPIEVTISIGAAGLIGGIGSPQSLILAAEQALYEAKQLGRNRTVQFYNTTLNDQTAEITYQLFADA